MCKQIDNEAIRWVSAVQNSNAYMLLVSEEFIYSRLDWTISSDNGHAIIRNGIAAESTSNIQQPQMIPIQPIMRANLVTTRSSLQWLGRLSTLRSS